MCHKTLSRVCISVKLTDTNMRLLSIAMLLIAMSSALTAHSQLAVKTNLLYDATTTPNLGAEVRVGSKSTINLVYGLNAWSFKGDSKVKHWLVMPEYRWWTCTPFSGHFFGVQIGRASCRERVCLYV